MVDLSKANGAMLVEAALRSLQQKADVRVLDESLLPDAAGAPPTDGAEPASSGS